MCSKAVVCHPAIAHCSSMAWTMRRMAHVQVSCSTLEQIYANDKMNEKCCGLYVEIALYKMGHAHQILLKLG